MSKKRMWIIGAIIVGIVILICIIFFGQKIQFAFLSAFGKEVESELEINLQESSSEQEMKIEVLALVKDEAEAQKIADMYEITFLRLNKGVAVFETSESFSTLEKMGDENGYPKLSKNNTMSINSIN